MERNSADDPATRGLPPTRLAAGWSAVVRSGVAAASGFGVPASRSSWNWYVSGSTARGEALPGSDVETMLVVDEDSELRHAADHAASVHAILDRCRIFGDDKGATASRARFCRTAEQWTAGIASWTTDPVADRGVVMAGLLADARSVSDANDDLRLALLDAIRGRENALSFMLTDTLAARAHFPSRLRLLAPREDRVDIKATALQPIVAISRWAALSAGVPALATVDRLAAVGGSRYLDADDASVLRECHVILTRIRWNHHAQLLAQDLPLDDELALSSLPPHDRALVRGVGREVTRIRRKLGFLASTSSFTHR